MAPSLTAPSWLGRRPSSTRAFRACSLRRRALSGGARFSGGAALAVGMMACSDPSDVAGDGAAFLGEAAACGAEGHQACDVLAPECQARLAEIAACQWGGPGTLPVLPPIVVQTRAMVRERLQAMVMTAAVPDPAVTAARGVLALLGLLPESFDEDDSIDLTANLLLAQYDPATDQIILVEDARTGDANVDNEILFHELIHAQQGARYDLQALLASISTLDSLVGIRALFEGEAQFHQNILDFGMFRVPIEPDTFRQGLDGARDQQDTALFADAVNAWSRSLLVAPYIYGPFSILETWLRGGPAAMAQRYASPSVESLGMLEVAFDRHGTSAATDLSPPATCS